MKEWCSILPPDPLVASHSNTHLTCRSVTSLALLSRGSGTLCRVLWRAVSFPECIKWPRLRRALPLQLLIWLRAFFPGSKELSFPLVHADPGGLSNLLAKCPYFYSCLCGNVLYIRWAPPSLDVCLTPCSSSQFSVFYSLYMGSDVPGFRLVANFSCASLRR